MASQHPHRLNLEDLYRPKPEPVQKTVVWEPYGLSSPRVARSFNEVVSQRYPPPKQPDYSYSNSSQNKKNQSVDEDRFYAYATYSPYRTSNSEYGSRKPIVHLINNLNQDPMNGDSQFQNNIQQISFERNQNMQPPFASPRSTQQRP